MVTFTNMLEGYRRFRSTGWSNQRSRWDELADGQSPRVMVIACSDSRVDPAEIFDTNPGEIFVVRNVAALVPPFETNPGRHGVSAAVEFAVQVLGVEEIVVVGHGLCGGCKAALTQELQDAPIWRRRFHRQLDIDAGRMLGPTSLPQHGEDRGRVAGRAMEQAAVKVSLDNLRSFPG